MFTNLTVRSANPERVANALRKIPGGRATIFPPDHECIVVTDDEVKDADGLQAFGRAVSKATHAAVLAVLSDGEVFCYWLYELGELADRYDSRGGASGDGDTLCRAFGVYDDASGAIDEMLRAPRHPDRHLALVETLGLSRHALPGGEPPEDCITVER